MIGISFIFIFPLLILIWSLYRFIVFKKNKTFNISREIIVNLFFLYFLVVINLTFFKSGILRLSFDNYKYVNLIPLIETIKMFNDNYMGVLNAYYNVIGNVLLFVPLGFTIPLLFKNKNKLINITFYGFLASFTIEALQYLTTSNTSDIDDIIFNTLGAIIGYIIFNLSYKTLKNTKLYSFYNSITSDYKGNLALISIKPIISMIIATSLLCLGVLYNSTSSGLLPDKALAKEVFNNYDNYNYVEACDFFDYKLFLYDFSNYLELRTIEKVLNDRWANGSMYQLHFTDENYGYSVMIVDNDNSKGIVVYGMNNDAKMIQITFNGKKYAEPLKNNTYFLVTFPTFEEIGKDSDILTFYSTGQSKTLDVDFIEENGDLCTHMKLIK